MGRRINPNSMVVQRLCLPKEMIQKLKQICPRGMVSTYARIAIKEKLDREEWATVKVGRPNKIIEQD